MERSLKRIGLHDETNLLTAMDLLRAEFTPSVTIDEYLNNNLESLKVSLPEFLNNPAGLLKGSDLFVLDGKEFVQGVTQTKYYYWDLLKKQIHFAVDRDESKQIKRLWLAPLVDIVGSRRDDSGAVASELAYFWVDPRMRGMGLGRLLFNAPLERFINVRDANYFLFTIAMGKSVGTKTGIGLLEYLLAKEKEVNGLAVDGKVIIKGVEVDWGELENVGYKSEMFQIRDESKATETLALNRGFDFLAFSRNLSSVFGQRI